MYIYDDDDQFLSLHLIYIYLCIYIYIRNEVLTFERYCTFSLETGIRITLNYIKTKGFSTRSALCFVPRGYFCFQYQVSRVK